MATNARGLAGTIGLLCALVLAACSSGSNRKFSPACIPPGFSLFGSPRPPPRALSPPLEAKILSSFAILRRSARPSDAPAVSRLTGGNLARQLYADYVLSSYYPAYVRRLAGGRGSGRDFLVPAFALREPVRPARCFATRARWLEAQERERRRGSEPLYCIIEPGTDGGTAGQGCEPFAAIGESPNLRRASDFHETRTVELVPDGVAAVRIAYPGKRPIVVPVRENTLIFRPPPASAHVASKLERLGYGLDQAHLTPAQRLQATARYDGALDSETDPSRIEWLGRAGRLIRVIGSITASPPAARLGALRAPIGG